MLEQLEKLQSTGLAELSAAPDADALETWRLAYLGGKGRVKQAAAGFRDVPKEDKPAVGQRLNQVKAALEEAYAEKKSNLGSAVKVGPAIDMTEPGIDPMLGRRHVITRVREELVDVFARMGFEVATGPELEDEEHNFTKLNIPADHPAREAIDNFYVDDPTPPPAACSARRPPPCRSASWKHASPPFKIISPGRVYRPDTVDATHSFMFHQIEGLYVDRGVTMADLKSTLLHFARAYFGEDADVRLVPSYFPFTEPSAEFYMKFALRPDQDPQWIELGGCGMVDPEVLKAVDIDPEEFTGFAFGFGIERLVMGKYGIPDIRMLYENDVRFLQQL